LHFFRTRNSLWFSRISSKRKQEIGSQFRRSKINYLTMRHLITTFFPSWTPKHWQKCGASNTDPSIPWMIFFNDLTTLTFCSHNYSHFLYFQSPLFLQLFVFFCMFELFTDNILIFSYSFFYKRFFWINFSFMNDNHINYSCKMTYQLEKEINKIEGTICSWNCGN